MDLAGARKARDGWPALFEERASSFARMLLRFSRPDGRAATVDPGPTDARSPRAFWRELAAAFPDPGVSHVLDWWFPGREAEPTPPPLPAWAATDRVLGVLRADWTPKGDLAAFDQREPGSTARFELFGSGVPWLGPRWRATDAAGLDVGGSTAAPTAWGTNAGADVMEWSFEADGLRVTRIALMLRGRRAALLADQVDGLADDGPRELRMEVPAGRSVGLAGDGGSLLLKPAAPGRSVQVIPIGREPGASRLTFDESTRDIRLMESPRGGRAWLPLFVSWDHARHRKALSWRPLTVVEQGKTCPPEVAWAARVGWGRVANGDETFVIYRSLGPAARRSFLGCSTTARFLIGRFTPEGDVDVIATLA